MNSTLRLSLRVLFCVFLTLGLALSLPTTALLGPVLGGATALFLRGFTYVPVTCVAQADGLVFTIREFYTIPLDLGIVMLHYPLYFGVVFGVAQHWNRKLAGIASAGLVLLLSLDALSLAARVWSAAPSVFPDRDLTYHALRLLDVWNEGGLALAPTFAAAFLVYRLGNVEPRETTP